MILIVFIIIGFFCLMGMIVFFKTRKKSCTCIGKPCGSTDGCGNTCCDPTKNEKCVNGKCCSADCSKLTCDQKNGCGESCKQYLCGAGEMCCQGNCQVSACSLTNCDSDGCGGPCTCPDGYVCHEGSCCKKEICSGQCGGEGSCGQPPCSCNDNYCHGTCCKNGQCTYENICENSPISTQEYLAKQWGQFCAYLPEQDPSKPRLRRCQKCNLENPQFLNDALAPIAGKITCESCYKDDLGLEINNDVEPIDIDPNVGFYKVDSTGNLIAGSSEKDYCKKVGCNSCICIKDSDCQRFGCTSCVNNSCT